MRKRVNQKRVLIAVHVQENVAMGKK